MLPVGRVCLMREPRNLFRAANRNGKNVGPAKRADFAISFLTQMLPFTVMYQVSVKRLPIRIFVVSE
jgi:hypothetical protein